MKLADINNAVLVWGPVSEQGLSCLKEKAKLVIVAENRPYLTGLLHNAPLLKKKGIDFVYCNDSALGLLFYKKKISEVVIFYKEEKDSGFLTYSGSLYAALLAKLHGVSVRLFPAEKLNTEVLDKDASALEGKTFILEENGSNYIIEAEEEFIGQEVLK